jgi:glycosyltransferase involved in cell wall biosynthesis
MKICVIGNYSENPDEGMEKVVFYLTKELSKSHEIMILNLKKIFSLCFWRDVKSYVPQIVYFITGPGILSFIFLKILTTFWGKNTKIIMAVIHYNRRFLLIKKFIPIFKLKPDIMLTQSYEYEEKFQKLGCRTDFLPNGVDTGNFVPVSKNEKEKLREKYGVDKKKIVILHVGHLTKVRNLRIFTKVGREEENQVIIVASTYFKSDQKIYNNLIEEGCLIWSGYFKNIEEIYALSDCYVFPVKKRYSILMPLSVMEAMSCNLPVITTKFDGLARIFEEGDGLIFAETEEDIIHGLKEIKKGDFGIKTREKVLPYSWENIAKRLEEIYEEMVVGKES